MPMSIITINDIMAYMVGFFGGRTPLIKLSPKKTKEGFIGGGLMTLILGTIFTHYLITPYLVCPVKSNSNYLSSILQFDTSKTLFSVSSCAPGTVFQPTLAQVRFLNESYTVRLRRGLTPRSVNSKSEYATF